MTQDRGTCSLGWPVSILGSQQEEVTGGREVWVTLLRLLHSDQTPDKWHEKEGNMYVFFLLLLYFSVEPLTSIV